jgi:hypothetical protein
MLLQLVIYKNFERLNGLDYNSQYIPRYSHSVKSARSKSEDYPCDLCRFSLLNDAGGDRATGVGASGASAYAGGFGSESAAWTADHPGFGTLLFTVPFGPIPTTQK